MAVRAPSGFAFVCDVRTNPPVLALSRALGRMPSSDRDSILVYAAGSWRAAGFVSEDRPGQRGMECVVGGATPDFQVRVQSGGTDDVAVGAPVRVFERRIYHRVRSVDGWWLAQTDAAGTEPLFGPLTNDGVRFRYVDAAGADTANPTDAAGIEIRLVARGRGDFGAALQDTVVMLFQGRNR